MDLEPGVRDSTASTVNEMEQPTHMTNWIASIGGLDPAVLSRTETADSNSAWPPTPEWTLACLNNFSEPSLGNYLMDHEPGVRDSTTSTVKEVEQHTHMTNRTASIGGLDPAVLSRTETADSNSACSSTGHDHYDALLFQLSRLQSSLHRLVVASTENKCRVCSTVTFGGSVNEGSAASEPARIDEAFAATETMTGILDQLSSMSLSSSSSISDSDVSYSRPHRYTAALRCMENYAGNDPSSQSAIPSVKAALPKHDLDTATILLILTCYLRLLHVYEIHIRSLQHFSWHSAKSDSSLSPSGSSSTSLLSIAQDSPPSLPAFNIGAFRFAASSDLKIRLLLHTAIQMLDRVQRAVNLHLPSTRTSRHFSSSAANDGGYTDTVSQSQGQDTGTISGCLHDPIVLVANTTLAEVRRKEDSVMEILYPSK